MGEPPLSAEEGGGWCRGPGKKYLPFSFNHQGGAANFMGTILAEKGFSRKRARQLTRWEKKVIVRKERRNGVGVRRGENASLYRPKKKGLRSVFLRGGGRQRNTSNRGKRRKRARIPFRDGTGERCSSFWTGKRERHVKREAFTVEEGIRSNRKRKGPSAMKGFDGPSRLGENDPCRVIGPAREGLQFSEKVKQKDLFPKTTVVSKK